MRTNRSDWQRRQNNPKEFDVIANFRRSLELKEVIVTMIQRTGNLNLFNVMASKPLQGAMAELENEGAIEALGEPDAGWCLPFRVVPEGERKAVRERMAIRNTTE